MLSYSEENKLIELSPVCQPARLSMLPYVWNLML